MALPLSYQPSPMAAPRTSLALTAAQDVYQRTAQLCNKQLKNDSSKKRWIKDKDSIQDIQDVVLEAKRIYETRSEKSKVCKWLSCFSSRFMYYSSVLDMLSQHHPEYVSLAWGTMKFLFILVLNHEELIVQLSKAMSKIGDVLPRVDLQIKLYQTEHMERHIEELYSEVTAFFDRALKWYKDGKVMHMLKSFTNPYALHFKDLVDRIEERTRRIDNLAATLAQAELQRMHALLESSQKGQEDIHNLLIEVKQIMITNHSVTSSQLMETHQSTCQIQLGQMVEATSKTTLSDPLQSLRYYQSMRNRRQARSSVDLKHITPTLQVWASSKDSSLLFIRGSLSTRLDVRDLVTDVIGVVNSANVPIALALEPKNESLTSEERPVHVIKHLVMQILQLNSFVASKISAGFNVALLQSARTEADWFGILKIVLSGLPQVFIIIHMEVFGRQGPDITWLIHFCRLMTNFIRENKDMVVKVAVANYRPLLLTSCFPDYSEDLSVRVDKSKSRGSNRRTQERNPRGRGKRGGLQTHHLSLLTG